MKETAKGIDICPHCGKAQSGYSCGENALRPETVLNGRYILGGVIGEGGFGITYIGYDTVLLSRVAVKEFFPTGMAARNTSVSDIVGSITPQYDDIGFDKCREDFISEARLLARYNNEDGIVSVRDFFEANNTAYFVMEYLDGSTLGDYVARVGRISYDNVLCLLMPVMDSLKKLHRESLIHGKICPDSIMLVDESVKLVDFGTAWQYANKNSILSVVKRGYSPIEQYTRHGAQGARTDIYALCATMYHCITGQRPPDSSEIWGSGHPLARPSEMGIGIAPNFERAMMKGLEPNAEDRPADIDELLNIINGVTDNAGPDVRVFEDIQPEKPAFTPEEQSPQRKEPSHQAPPVDFNNGRNTFIPEERPRFFDGGANAGVWSDGSGGMSSGLSSGGGQEITNQPANDVPRVKSRKGAIIAAACISAVVLGGAVIGLASGKDKSGGAEITTTAATETTETTATTRAPRPLVTAPKTEKEAAAVPTTEKTTTTTAKTTTSKKTTTTTTTAAKKELSIKDLNFTIENGIFVLDYEKIDGKTPSEVCDYLGLELSELDKKTNSKDNELYYAKEFGKEGIALYFSDDDHLTKARLVSFKNKGKYKKLCKEYEKSYDHVVGGGEGNLVYFDGFASRCFNSYYYEIKDNTECVTQDYVSNNVSVNTIGVNLGGVMFCNDLSAFGKSFDEVAKQFSIKKYLGFWSNGSEYCWRSSNDGAYILSFKDDRLTGISFANFTNEDYDVVLNNAADYYRSYPNASDDKGFAALIDENNQIYYCLRSDGSHIYQSFVMQ